MGSLFVYSLWKAMSDTFHVLVLCEPVVNIPALLPQLAPSLPVLSQPFLCVLR